MQATDSESEPVERVLDSVHVRKNLGYSELVSGAPADTTLGNTTQDGGVKIDITVSTLEDSNFHLPKQIETTLEHKSWVGVIADSNAMATTEQVARQQVYDH